MKGLYLVTDRGICGSRSLDEVVRDAVRGGVQAVQLREKDLPIPEVIAAGRALRCLLAPLGVPLIINDRVDVALAVGADGVHLGQHDMGYHEARARLGQQALIGFSVETMEQVIEAESWEVAYLGVSPVFDTPTKTDTACAWGLEGLRQVRRASRHALVAIGGIHAGNLHEVLRAGADAVAVVSAICGAPDPYGAACELRSIIDNTTA